MKTEAAIGTGREVAGAVRAHVVADDAEALHAVMQAIERRELELTESRGNDAAPRVEAAFEPVARLDVEAVGE